MEDIMGFLASEGPKGGGEDDADFGELYLSHYEDICIDVSLNPAKTTPEYVWFTHVVPTLTGFCRKQDDATNCVGCLPSC
eukprot:2578969-Karenia_brevis.AAC.1